MMLGYRLARLQAPSDAEPAQPPNERTNFDDRNLRWDRVRRHEGHTSMAKDSDHRDLPLRQSGLVGDTESHLSLTASAGQRRPGMVFLGFRPPASSQVT